MSGATKKPQVADLRPLKEVHPTGLEPVTFGSVDRFHPTATSDAVNSCDDAAERLGVLLGVLGPKFEGLSAVVKAWPNLSEPMRRAILAMVKASK